MKKILLVLIASLLVACSGNSSDSVKDKVDEKIETVFEMKETDFKVIEEEDSELEDGERVIVRQGKKGKYGVVTEKETGKFLNDWVYEVPVDEIVKIGVKNEVVENTSDDSLENGNYGGDMNEAVRPPQNDNSVAPKPQPTPPTAPKEVAIVGGEVGNSGMIFDTQDQARAFGNSVISDYNTAKQWEEKLNMQIDGWSLNAIRYSDDSTKYSINFY